MATVYYNINDLFMRRAYTAKWICHEMKRFLNQICYGELIPQQTTMNFQYIVATLEAVECYTPITTDAEDGVANCLTEAQLDSFFDNVTEVTGLCFLPKNSTYRNPPPAPTGTSGTITLGGGDWEVDSDLDTEDTLDETGPEPYDPDTPGAGSSGGG